jgi:phosphopantothenoylcysteine synthetase/decarboxylase
MKNPADTILKGKEIVLGICGSIAAYKVPELIRMLKSADARVSCILTKNGAHFVTPLTLQTLSCNQVYQGMFDPVVWDIEHISLAQKADLIAVVPASADALSRFASGRAEDLLSSVILAAASPVLLCPAMNERMWIHPATQANVEHLKEYGYHFVLPEKGELACGVTGVGRLANLETVYRAIIGVIGTDRK